MHVQHSSSNGNLDSADTNFWALPKDTPKDQEVVPDDDFWSHPNIPHQREMDAPKIQEVAADDDFWSLPKDKGLGNGSTGQIAMR